MYLSFWILSGTMNFWFYSDVFFILYDALIHIYIFLCVSSHFGIGANKGGLFKLKSQAIFSPIHLIDMI